MQNHVLKGKRLDSTNAEKGKQVFNCWGKQVIDGKLLSGIWQNLLSPNYGC